MLHYSLKWNLSKTDRKMLSSHCMPWQFGRVGAEDHPCLAGAEHFTRAHKSPVTQSLICKKHKEVWNSEISVSLVTEVPDKGNTWPRLGSEEGVRFRQTEVGGQNIPLQSLGNTLWLHVKMDAFPKTASACCWYVTSSCFLLFNNAESYIAP